jgi:hypothetical protein
MRHFARLFALGVASGLVACSSSETGAPPSAGGSGGNAGSVSAGGYGGAGGNAGAGGTTSAGGAGGVQLGGGGGVLVGGAAGVQIGGGGGVMVGGAGGVAGAWDAGDATGLGPWYCLVTSDAGSQGTCTCIRQQNVQDASAVGDTACISAVPPYKCSTLAPVTTDRYTYQACFSLADIGMMTCADFARSRNFKAVSACPPP